MHQGRTTTDDYDVPALAATPLPPWWRPFARRAWRRALAAQYDACREPPSEADDLKRRLEAVGQRRSANRDRRGEAELDRLAAEIDAKNGVAVYSVIRAIERTRKP